MKKHILNFLKIFGFIITFSVIGAILYILKILVFDKENTMSRNIAETFHPLISVIIVTVLFNKIIDKNKYNINVSNKIENIIFGLLFGIGWIGMSILILFLNGNILFDEIQYIQNIHLWMILALISAISNIYLTLGYTFSLLKNEYNTITAIIITTMITIMLNWSRSDGGIIAILNIATMNIFMSLLLVYKNIISSIIAFAVWNIIGFLLGIIEYGNFPVLINSTIAGNEIITGGKYKLEGSIISLLVTILGIISISFIMEKDKENKSNFA
jgi:hypothetical protein